MSESLRDQLAANLDKIVARDTTDETPAVPVEPSSIAEAPAEPRPSKITTAPPATEATAVPDGRARNPDGTFAEKPKEAPKGAGAAPKASTPQPPPPATGATAAAVPAAAKARPQRPSSWKKEFWPHWETLDPSLAEYLNTRESQFASGVSTYKAEAEAAKPLVEAIAPFMPLLQQHQIDPGQWIRNLGSAHQRLVMGSPHEKLQLFAKLADDYGIPLQALYDQGAQQQYLSQPHYPQPQPQSPNVLTRAEAEKFFEQKYQEKSSLQEIDRFSASDKHPHFDEVRETMAGLLQANLADDLESAYQAALRHPRHTELWNAVQEQERSADETKRREQEAARLAQAKGKAVSTRSSTPSAPAGSEKPKGLRAQIEAAAEQHLSGRV